MKLIGKDVKQVDYKAKIAFHLDSIRNGYVPERLVRDIESGLVITKDIEFPTKPTWAD